MSLDGHEEHSWGGQPVFMEGLLQMYEAICTRPYEALRTAWQLHLVDSVRGREDRLCSLCSTGASVRPTAEIFPVRRATDFAARPRVRKLPARDTGAREARRH